MEMLELIQFNNIYKGRKVLVTGHTGFKGSWLVLWLQALGAEVIGISFDKEDLLDHWKSLNLNIEEYQIDITNYQKLKESIEKIQPEFVFHLAAQSLVLQSYNDPLKTWNTNVMGTAHLLDICRNLSSLKAMVLVTTDKVYRNNEWEWGYRENEPLGGQDPYSASKSACEMLINSYDKSFYSHENAPLIASVRAGNVIGGGDWNDNRLIPDIARSVNNNEILTIRSPHSTRPWQHVLDCLSAYLLIGQKLIERNKKACGSWNIGPDLKDNINVESILDIMKKYWSNLKWKVNSDRIHFESNYLHLDCSKIYQTWNWKPVWNIEKSLKHTTTWYKKFMKDESVISHSQLMEYLKDSLNSSASWLENGH